MLQADDRVIPLAAAFPPATRQQWLEAVRGVVLRSKPDASEEEFAAAFARLVSTTDDGIEIQPLYDGDDSPVPPPLPGMAPYVRGTRPAPVPWEIRQRVWPGVDGSAAVTELESGATGVLIEVPAGADAQLFDQALEGVHLHLAPVSLAADPDADPVAVARLLVERWDRAGTPTPSRLGTLGVDPIRSWARTGGNANLATMQAGAAELVSELAESAPSARVLLADGTVWHDAGASEGRELAWTIATAAAHVRSLVDAGVPLERATAQVELRWAATADQFATIAKLRAARRLWARVAEIAGLAPAQRTAFHHADGSRAMLTRYDTWVNALRSTVACFAAAYGGADAITVWPHDSARDAGGSDLGRRIARNTQTVLQMESNLARVADPAGGSWYVERLTEELARTAWTELTDIEARGGIVAAVESGAIHERLADARARRQRQIDTRARPITGLSEFPDIDESPPPPVAPPLRDGHTPFEPLTLHRLSEGFEIERGRADVHAAATGVLPAVFLATLGPLTASGARATFAKNLFEAGGIRTVQGTVDQFSASGLTVVCLCSSDAVYAEEAEQAAGELRAAGAARVYIAGRKLNVPGVDEEIGLGCDVRDVLARTLDALGVGR